MTEQLGKLERPEAAQFEGKRKLYLVALFYAWEDAPAEYMEKFNLYWQQVSEHIVNLEGKIGKVKHVYHESISAAGEEGLKILERLNPAACSLARDKCQQGAQLEAAEDRELLEENMDWERHLLLGFISRKVADLAYNRFSETSKRRYEDIGQRIDRTLLPEETGILIIREGHLVQFPADIEVFSVAPPALDDIHRWLREREHAAAEEEKGEKKEKS
ncbi:MAG: hypothetical protein ABIH70_07490 [Chloroflexota bacterium]